MTNPDNAVRVRARNGGRASVYEANGWAQIYKQGLLAGTGVTEDTRASMNVLVGGSQSAPDVVIAETASHYKIGMDIVGQVPVTITAPGSNSRLTAIIVYTDDLSVMSEETSITGSPATCGLITVNGDTHASNPQPPSDSQIRQVITADGATGGQAAYAVIALVKVSAGVENISNSMITIQRATDAIVTSENVDFATFGNIKLDDNPQVGNYNNSPVYLKIISGTTGSSGSWKNIANIGSDHHILQMSGVVEHSDSSNSEMYAIPGNTNKTTEGSGIYYDRKSGNISVAVISTYFASKPCTISILYY